MNKENPFQSFWMAGYECSDKLNSFGDRVDLMETTGHLDCLEADYRDLSLFDITTVREGIRWSDVEKKPYRYNWSVVGRMIEAGMKSNIQQIWDLCHFGFPDDLTPLHPMFARRFSHLCSDFVKFYRSIRPDGELIITPINEVSFLSWLGGDVRATTPYCVGQGWELKYRLMKAYIEGVEALKYEDPSVRIMTSEPLISIVPPLSPHPDQVRRASALHDEQFQVTDILSGRMCPELRGKEEYIDILGSNYYYNNQWEMHTNDILHWRTPEARRIPLSRLLAMVSERYGRPVVISETSHPKEDKPFWIEMITEGCLEALAARVPLWGVCWYPIIDRPDWDNLKIWHDAGLWRGEYTGSTHPRTLDIPAAGYFIRAQARISDHLNGRTTTVAGKNLSEIKA